MNDIEQRLRDALQTKAAEAVPDPNTWDLVDRRLRRQRVYIWAGAGAAVATAVIVAILVVPRVIPVEKIIFDPGPVATQPGDASESPAFVEYPPVEGSPEGIVYSDGTSISVEPYESSADEEQSAGGISPPDLALTRLTVAPWSTTSGATVLYVNERAGEVAVEPAGEGSVEVPSIIPVLHYVDTAAGGSSGDLGSFITSAEFSPEGGYMAYVETVLSSGAPLLQFAAIPNGSLDRYKIENTMSLREDWRDVVVTDWVWTGQGRFGPSGFVVVSATTETIGRQRQTFVIDIESLADAEAEHETSGNDVVGIQWRTAPRPIPPADGWNTVALNGGWAIEVQYDERDDDAFIVTAGRLTWDGAPMFELPPEYLEVANRDLSRVWVSGYGNTVAYGDGAGYAAIGAVEEDGEFSLLRNLDAVDVDFIAPQAVIAEPMPSEPPTPPPSEPAASTTTVQVFFGAEPGSPVDLGTGDCGDTYEVAREVEGSGVLRGALTELMQGPTEAEGARGYTSFFSSETAGMLNDVTITDGIARVDLDGDMRTVISGASSSCGSEAFLNYLNSTVRQFKAVDEVIYSFDGNVSAFYDFVQRPAPTIPGGEGDLPAAVEETRAAVSDAAFAALDGNTGPLRELITIGEDFTCFPGPSGRACVDFWEDQAQQGSNPFKILNGLLEGAPQKQSTADRWVWKGEESNPNAEGGPSGPQVGIDADGTWRFFVQPGD